MTKQDKVYSVNEIFTSIEGEGIRTGFLSTFVRFNGCNLACGYCDTKYAQEPQEPNMSLHDIIEAVSQSGCGRVTLTGGEPLFRGYMQELIQELSWLGYHVNIETNGSIILPDCVTLPGVFVTMDWKCPSSGQNGSMKSENLKNLTLVDVLKFVVATEEDLAEFKRIYEQNLVCTYVLSPVFGAIEPKALVEFIKENKMNNAMVQVQLHKIIWDPNERGV